MVAFPTCCVLHLATSGSQKNLRIGAQCFPPMSGDPETTALQGLGTRSAQRGQHRPLLSALLLCLYPSWKCARKQETSLITHISLGCPCYFLTYLGYFPPRCIAEVLLLLIRLGGFSAVSTARRMCKVKLLE